MKPFAFYFSLFSMISTSYLYANKYEYTGTCKFNGNMNIFEYCLDKELSNYDRELNNLYKDIYKKTSNKRLKNAELIWIKFKEADCTYIAYEVNEGSEFQSIQKACLINKTKARITDLKRSFFYSGWFKR